MTRQTPQLSVIVPVLNEAAGLEKFYTALAAVLTDLGLSHEVIFVDDGSTDATRQIVQRIASADKRVKLLALTRNVGKEIALSAGLRTARGEAMMLLDADGQHPVGAIPAFVREWQRGARVVVGHRSRRRASLAKRLGSRLFYGVFRRLFRVRLDPDSSDFRLIDRTVCDEFNRLGEHNRMTRSLIDWFGYRQATVPYDEHERLDGTSPYTVKKLMKLAVDDAISHSTSPLYAAAYTGAAILALSTLLGVGMLLNFLLHDPLGLQATASAYGLVLILFLIGLLLVSQGIIGLYLAHIYAETQGRPLYVVDEKESRL